MYTIIKGNLVIIKNDKVRGFVRILERFYSLQFKMMKQTFLNYSVFFPLEHMRNVYH